MQTIVGLLIYLVFASGFSHICVGNPARARQVSAIAQLRSCGFAFDIAIKDARCTFSPIGAFIVGINKSGIGQKMLSVIIGDRIVRRSLCLYPGINFCHNFLPAGLACSKL